MHKKLFEDKFMSGYKSKWVFHFVDKNKNVLCFLKRKLFNWLDKFAGSTDFVEEDENNKFYFFLVLDRVTYRWAEADIESERSKFSSSLAAKNSLVTVSVIWLRFLYNPLSFLRNTFSAINFSWYSFADTWSLYF